MKKIFFLIFIISFNISYSQKLPFPEASEELKKDALGIIRYENCTFILKDLTYGVEKVTRQITILDNKGLDFANIEISLDKYRKLKNFSGEIILESGKVFKKIGKSDLRTTEISNELASDESTTYYSCSSPSYPFTFSYTYEIEWKNGITTFPIFAPMLPEISVQKSTQSIIFPKKIKIRYKGNDVAPAPVKTEKDNDSIYTWAVENIPAIVREPLSPPFYTLTPFVRIAPSAFYLDGIEGDMSTWKSTGIFLTKLMEGRKELPDAIKAKVKEMVCDNKRETVQRIFEYFQNSTRYVSIQLGIGGYQPFEASEVALKGFGDCKALSNYMKSLLSVVGIESEYCIVNTNKKKFYSDFSSLNQANHVILFVPLEKDTIWLECTSKNLPFDYAHSSIAGHDVLMVSGENSRLIKVRDIAGRLNSVKNTIKVLIQSNASATAEVVSIYKCHMAEDMIDFVINMPEKEKINYLAEDLYVQSPQISNITNEYLKSSYPKITVKYLMSSKSYAVITGTRLFIQSNPFRNSFGKSLKSSSRKYDILIQDPIHQKDSIVYVIPNNLTVEALPNPVNLSTDFGIFDLSVKYTDNQIVLIYKIDIPEGKYPASAYNEFRTFLNTIDKNINSKIVLKQ